MIPLYRLADLWIGRRRRNRGGEREALAAVAGLKPIVVVTGASRGIGAAIALRFAEAGFDVAVIARDAAALTAMAEKIARNTERVALPIAQDLAVESSAQTLDAALRTAGYYADVLVNNAAIGLAGAFTGETPEDLAALIALNVTATAKLMHHFLGPMRERRRGGILNVASLAGAVPGPNQAAYYASKAFVLSLTEAVGAELAGLGVRVAVLAPGPVETGMHAGMGAARSPYRILVPSLTTAQVAGAAYRGFMLGQRVIVPGLLHRLTYGAVRFLPHPLIVPIVKWLLSTPRQDREG